MLTIEKIDIERLAKSDLPTLSTSAMRVSSLMRDENVTTRAVSDALGSDPALAAQVLRAANSPLYALVRRVTTLPAAVNVLGTKTIHALVIISAAANSFDRFGRNSKYGKRLWQHSVETGLVARELSRELGMRGNDESFLCGLLHDIGKLVMLRHDEQRFALLDEREPQMPPLAREMAVYGFTHTQVGALIMKRWELPEEICHAVSDHHNPGEARFHGFMARLVDVADQLSHASESEDPGRAYEELATTESALALRLTPGQLSAVWERAQSQLPEVVGSLG